MVQKSKIWGRFSKEKRPLCFIKGVTLLEILISLIILSLVMGGMASVLVLGKSFILHSRARMTAAEGSRVFLDPLQQQVREDEWSSNCLGNNNGCQGQTTFGDIDYTPNWNIDDVAGTNLRRVRLRLSWTES